MLNKLYPYVIKIVPYKPAFSDAKSYIIKSERYKQSLGFSDEPGKESRYRCNFPIFLLLC